jgi:Transposase IS66 family
MKDLAGAALAVDGTLNGTGPGAAARHEFRSAVLIGQALTAARAGPLMRKHHALARRLREREDDYLRFITDPRAPFDNNAAEREIRMAKTADQGLRRAGRGERPAVGAKLGGPAASVEADELQLLLWPTRSAPPDLAAMSSESDGAVTASLRSGLYKPGLYARGT